ncbi:MAG: hypothetical protein QME89_11785 [Actinomycetota bacterium]|nr:hypothetical protein [Actinomycetota bacterium]
MMMYTEHEIECWYLGLPFEEERREATTIEFPYLNDEEVERIFLGLPLAAA